MNTTEDKLADALGQLAKAVRDQTAVLDVMIEAMPATVQAKILGVSERTVRNHRKARANERRRLS